MAKSESIHPVVIKARLKRGDRRRAKREARRDAAAGVPAIPADGSGEAPVSEFVALQESSALRASKQLQVGLRADTGGHAVRVHDLAEILVYGNDVAGRRSDGQRGRFLRAFAEWGGQVAECRRRAEAAVDHANQMVAWYWMHLTRRHPELAVRPGLRPPVIALDPIWDKPDPVFFLDVNDVDDQATARMLRTVLRALEILGERDDDQEGV